MFTPTKSEENIGKVLGVLIFAALLTTFIAVSVLAIL